MSSENEMVRMAEDPGYIDEQDGSVGEALGWHIQDVETADWALSRLGALETEIAENEEMANRAICRIQERVRVLNDRAMKGVRFFRGRVEEWANLNKAILLKGGKKKSRAFVHGVVGWRESGGGLEVIDRDVLMEWARNQPIELCLVRTKEEPEMLAIKKHAGEKGLIPPGTQERPRVDKIHVEAVSVELTRKEK